MAPRAWAQDGAIDTGNTAWMLTSTALVILMTGKPFGFIPRHPLANRARADAYGLADGLRRLPAGHQLYDPLSTTRCQAGILVHVHPALLQDR
jgi:hypothetical protein